ncbi:MAG: hypothetical protein IPP29_13300 [Bacteroidetes bacterium]|nr:hypothetical protein [Bacteroidota bacterium]
MKRCFECQCRQWVVWAEFKPDGTVTYSAANKGSGCIGCHSGTPNRDSHVPSICINDIFQSIKEIKIVLS